VVVWYCCGGGGGGGGGIDEYPFVKEYKFPGEGGLYAFAVCAKLPVCGRDCEVVMGCACCCWIGCCVYTT